MSAPRSCPLIHVAFLCGYEQNILSIDASTALGALVGYARTAAGATLLSPA
jgi:hypothetical protein